MRLLLPAVLLTTVALGACASSPSAPQAPSTSPQTRLQALIAHAWQQEMENNPLEASLDGDHRYDDRWGDPSFAQQQREIREMQANLAALEKIDASKLSPAEQLNYQLFEYQLKDNLTGAKLRDSDQGLITQLWGPQLMAGTVKQLRFDSLADYRNWLKRLQTFGTYLQAYTQRLQQAVNQGITQPRVVMERIPDEIEGAIKKPTKSGFYAPFKHMPSTIPAAEQAKLRAEAKRAITQVVNPAYEKFAKFFKDAYLQHARKQIGVSSLPGGKAYYTYLVKHFTTTDMTPAQVHQLGLEQVKHIRSEMQAVFEKIGFKGSYQDFLHYLRTNPKFYYKSPQALLEAYRAATKRVDPNLVKIASTWILPRVPYGVRPIPKALAPNTYPAYSVPPAGDGSVAGYVGVNLYKPETRPKYDIQVLMCHEGRPGHQLQIPIAMQLKNLPPFRRFAYYNVYGEGWALYSETLCNELGLYNNPYSKFGYLNYQMWRAVRLVVDTGIHYYGWSREKAVKYMQDNTALADQNIDTEVDRYIVWPGQALSYMIGEMHILKLRAEAQRVLGDKYSLRDFDDVVLGEGSLPMAVLTAVVNRWIAHTLAGMPADQLPYADKPRSLGNGSGSSADDPPAAGSTGGNATAATASRPSTYVIQRAKLESPTVLKLEYSVGYAPCYGKLGQVQVKQHAKRVSVTLHRTYPQPAGTQQMCPQYRKLEWMQVTLDAPLGNRTLVDGSTGNPVAVH
ncbi:MAG: DUF885 domain-containing protein [Gammaproteobacteria bacterium]